MKSKTLKKKGENSGESSYFNICGRLSGLSRQRLDLNTAVAPTTRADVIGGMESDHIRGVRLEVLRCVTCG